MSLIVILIPLFFVYTGILIYLYKRYRLLVPRVSTTADAKPTSGLVRLVKWILNATLVLMLVVAIVWPAVMLVMAISQHGNPEWGIDISVFARFWVDVNQLAGVDVVGLRDPVFNGKADIGIDTSNRMAWYAFSISHELGVIAGIWGVQQLRMLTNSLANGRNFIKENAKYIQNIGVLVIGWNLVWPFVQYGTSYLALNSVIFSNQAIELVPAFQVQEIPLFTGLALLVLAKIMREAITLQQEQSLTI